MKTALTTNGTQAMMVERPSSLAAICVQEALCSEDMLIACSIAGLEAQHVN